MEPQTLNEDYQEIQPNGIEICLLYPDCDEAYHEGYYSSVEDAIKALKNIHLEN